ncbi:hypothetical protein L9F63_005960 [Diploptera punctata]|uniref:Uncharacterized protein n=1 Tax=Diploptera punctata TaxID=6984 RepID=A0AAD7ZB73_DIPPU|nr:hypothetical protein L9F63_005960 [Diploptera punctata]
MSLLWSITVCACVLVASSLAQDLAESFKNCEVGAPGFDTCVKNGLNTLQPFFTKGIEKYNIKPFDPFFAKEVSQKRGGSRMNYKLKLTNVMESGWTKSHVTNFRSNLKNYMIKYSQFFPEKYLEGEYEVQGTVFEYPLNNKGNFNLTLYNYTQTTTAVRRPTNNSKYGPVKVRIHQDGIGDMKLHISNLIGGRAVMENILDGIINVSWRPFLPIVKPMIDDLVSSAFTEILDKNFRNFPFEEIFPK